VHGRISPLAGVERAQIVSELPTTCILAGGLGTRLGDRVRNVPKPLIEIAGEPFLFHQLRMLAGHGARHVVICVGYHGDLIEDRVGRERFGIEIDYSHDAPGLDGTLGAVRRALPLLGARFLVLYGDTYLRIDYAAVARAWADSGLPAVMCVLRNDDRWDTSNACYESGRVLVYDKARPTRQMHWIDYGLGGLGADALSGVGSEARDLGELYGRLASRGQLFGYEASERFFEIGTPAALAEADRFLSRSTGTG
jgi:NDP-sugar pyrophosphorylase family protein